jgi:predicted DCC family thiol-disulfide oxidoreductase YuxK
VWTPPSVRRVGSPDDGISRAALEPKQSPNDLNRLNAIMQGPAMSSKLTVWYNTKCPICNAGIGWQRSRLVRAARAGAIEFRDINLEPGALARFGAGVEDVRRRLHAVDADGQLYVGADCAIAIWLRTPGDAWLGRALGLPVIRHLTGFGYDRFADLLYAWNRWKKHW